MENKQIITPEMVEKELSKFKHSRSTTVLSKIHKGFEIGEDLWKEFQSDVDYALNLFKKLPNNHPDIKSKLAEIILAKSPGKISLLIELTSGDIGMQMRIFDLFEKNN